MKTKELKKMAQQIIDLEKIIEEQEDKKEIEKAKNKIFELSSKISVEDMLTIDELIQEMLNK